MLLILDTDRSGANGTVLLTLGEFTPSAEPYAVLVTSLFVTSLLVVV